MSTLPDQAVDMMVREHIDSQDPDYQPYCTVYPCGCQSVERGWRLCRYHDGMNDGIAMAAAPTPTPDHCPTCRGTWKIVRGQHPHYACSNVAWHDSQG